MGRNEYCDLFKMNERFGRLLVHQYRERDTQGIEVYVLPDFKTEKLKKMVSYLLSSSNFEGVKVYGVISGKLGNNEVYGWIHEGKWKDDFLKIVKERREVLDELDSLYQLELQEKHDKDVNRANEVLDTY